MAQMVSLFLRKFNLYISQGMFFSNNVLDYHFAKTACSENVGP